MIDHESVPKDQRAGSWPVRQTSLHNPCFAKRVEDCGGLGIRVTEAEALDEALAKALAQGGFSLVEMIADSNLI